MFLKFELFAKRLGKLCEMFTSINEISGLEQHRHITGVCNGWARGAKAAMGMHRSPCFLGYD